MKFCTRCGQAANDDFKFCMGCGGDVSQAPIGAAIAPPPAGKSNTKIILIVVLVAAFVLAVPIIAIIAAIAIPNLIRARIAANEASAVGSVRTIETAEVTYAGTYPSAGFSPDLQSLGGTEPCNAPSKEHACLIDAVLGGGVKTGYVFQYEAEPADDGGVVTHFKVWARPQSNGSGRRSFYSDETGVIRYEMNGSANESSPPL